MNVFIRRWAGFLSRNRIAISMSALVAMIAMVSGCSGNRNGEPQRFHIGGNVTFSDAPVPYGVIEFIPANDESLPSSSANIENGSYHIDRGLPEGKYRVKITGSETPPMEAASMDAMATTPPVKELIPSKYNTKSTLELVVHSDLPHQEFHLEK